MFLCPFLVKMYIFYVKNLRKEEKTKKPSIKKRQILRTIENFAQKTFQRIQFAKKQSPFFYAKKNDTFDLKVS